MCLLVCPFLSLPEELEAVKSEKSWRWTSASSNEGFCLFKLGFPRAAATRESVLLGPARHPDSHKPICFADTGQGVEAGRWQAFLSHRSPWNSPEASLCSQMSASEQEDESHLDGYSPVGEETPCCNYVGSRISVTTPWAELGNVPQRLWARTRLTQVTQTCDFSQTGL